MAFPGNSETDLLIMLQQAAIGDGEWIDFIRIIGALTSADAVVLDVQVGDEFLAPITWAMPGTDGHAAIIAALDIVPRCASVRAERVYDQGELGMLDGDSVALGSATSASVFLRAVRVDAAEWASLTIVLASARDFDASDGAVLRRLFPYVSAAAKTVGHAAALRAREAVASEAARRGALQWLLLDREATIVDRSIGDRVLPHGMGTVQIPGGERLILGDRGAEQRLAGWLQAYDARDLGDHFLWLDAAQSVGLRLTPYGRCWIGTPRRPVALAMIDRPTPIPDEAAALLTEMFGFLPSEARLALALARGHSLADAADALGLTIETARNYSKRLFAKAGAQGQADLVRRMLSMNLSAR